MGQNIPSPICNPLEEDSQHINLREMLGEKDVCPCQGTEKEHLSLSWGRGGLWRRGITFAVF